MTCRAAEFLFLALASARPPRSRRRPRRHSMRASTRSSGRSTTSSRRARSRRRGVRWKASPFPRGTRTASSASSSTGASTRCRRSATSGTRATCTSRTSRSSRTTSRRTARSRTFGYKDFIPRFTAEHFDAARMGRAVQGGRRALRRAGGGAPRRLPDVRLQRHASGAPRRWARSATSSASLRRPCGPRGWCSASRRTAPSTGGSSTRARRSTPTCAIRRYAAFYGPAVDRKTSEAQKTPPDAAFLERLAGAVRAELVDKYQPQLVWFDWWIAQPAVRSRTCSSSPPSTTTAARSGTKGVAINYKKHGGESFPDTRRRARHRARPAGRHPPAVLADRHVGLEELVGLHRRTRTTRRSDSIVDDLVDIVSKNGALLLNIGPKPDGTIPEPEAADAARDRAVAGGERRGHLRHAAVDACSARARRQWSKARSPTRSASRSRRATSGSRRKGKTLYAILLAWPDGRQGHNYVAGQTGTRTHQAKSATWRWWDRRRRSCGPATRRAYT